MLNLNILLMGIVTTVVISVVVFLFILLLLIIVLLYAKAKLVPSGPVKVSINGERTIEVISGTSLLSTLSEQKIFLPSANARLRKAVATYYQQRLAFLHENK
ncbi:MAG: Na(+)-translocating NADH-quinone reductase subunit F [Bacteroidetes bacterium ADurb.Bin408]|nr:MAG: Na(+)-translocating NADH-quinone reductase subunit F [Bacteroidetes bacterium ADurb.Bin408]